MIIDKPGDAFLKIAKPFLAGGAVTAFFSGSLVRLAANAELADVLAVGIFVPSFTWVVQLAASRLLLKHGKRRIYQEALGRVCMLGSVALLPAAVLNLCLAQPPVWISAANVVASVVLMAVDLFHRCAAQKISRWWTASWCGTIAVNIALFLWVSRNWWSLPS